MRDTGTQQAPTSAPDQASSEPPGPGKQTQIGAAAKTSTQRPGDKAGGDAKADAGPGKQTLVESLQHAEQRLQKPGYQYLAPFARPMIAEARKPSADPSLAAKLDHLFEVSKTHGAGDLRDAKAASNAYHARLGDQALAELSSKTPAGSPQARTALEPVARALEAKYAPLLEDEVHLMIHLGQIPAKHGGRTPALSVEVSIRPNDFGCFGWLSWEAVAGVWRMIRGGAEPAAAPTERSPLLGDPQQQLAQQPKPNQPMVAASGDAASHDAPPKTNAASSDAHASGDPSSSGAPAPVGKEDKPIPEEATAFAAKYKATGMPKAHDVGTVNITPHPVKQPSAGKKQPGYVINMATIPSEVQPTMASRYFEGEREQAADRTAVVVGVNTFLGMDSGKDGDKKAGVTKGITSVAAPKGQMAVFGYTWDPGWQMEGADAPLSSVREEWRKLPLPAQAPAAKLMDDTVKDTLPYGFFRNQVLNAKHTKDAVAEVGKHADPVHIVVQDADGGVLSASGEHVLTAYDEVLKDMARHPLLTIGGYHFQGHAWPAESDQRTQRLTELSNAVDRAIRAAIATAYPEMLYPTEPNMLIKAKDDTHKDGVFDRQLDEHPKGLFGLGASEGRTARQNIMRADNAQGDAKHPQPIAYAPSTSTMTSPVPERPERGLTVPATPEYIAHATSGELYKERTRANKVSPDKQYASMVVEEQSQNPLAPRRLNQEFLGAWEQHDPAAADPAAANPSAVSNANKKKVKSAFEQPAAEVKTITTPPAPVAAVEAPEASNEAASPIRSSPRPSRSPRRS
jgi:hypothetical protein